MHGVGAAAPTALRVHQNCKFYHILKDENKVYRLQQILEPVKAFATVPDALK